MGTAGDDTDVSLIARVAMGDGEALAAIYDRHADALMGIAFRVLGARADAEDVVHDAFMGLCDQAARYDPNRGRLRTWLVTMVRNLAIDRLRKQRRLHRIRETLRDNRDMSAAAPDILASLGSALGRGGLERFRDVFAALPEDQRATLEATFFEGLSYSEIAERDGVPLGTVKSRAARAIGTLREELLQACVQGEPSSVVSSVSRGAS